jgi:protein gp37
MKDSGVNWCDSSINPTERCIGCELWNDKTGIHECYAGIMWSRWHPDISFQSPEVDLKPGRMKVCRNWPDLRGKNRIDKPWLNRLPRIVFISDMSDAILADFDYLLQEVITVVRDTPHLYLWPTKHANRMVQFAQYLETRGLWPKNLVPGISITSRITRIRLAEMMKYWGWPKLPFISYEPALEYIDLRGVKGYFSWVVFGGQSGAGKKPVSVDLMRRVKQEVSGISWFSKQLGGPTKLENLDDFPEDLRIREFPADWYK